jgi:EAL domain-containing protein (putative c-di-GMP-specific phosphodiesterase class I)
VLMAQLIAPCHRDEETAGLHYEILARMLDEKGNVMSPASFLPAIARAGLSREFDRLIIESTFDYLATDKALCARTAACAINVTGRMISSPELPSLIKIQLQRTGLSPALFVIEITESESIDDIEEAKANARELKRMGITVAVDDFGTGLATFDYLKQFKPQILKIDGSFIRTFDDSPLDRAIVQSIVRVAATIGARTVAEWVETEDLGRKLRGLGVDFLQGYAIAKPVPIGQLGALRQDPAFLGAPSASSVSGDRRASAAALIHLPEPA